jgi:hypothetical protein
MLDTDKLVAGTREEQTSQFSTDELWAPLQAQRGSLVIAILGALQSGDRDEKLTLGDFTARVSQLPLHSVLVTDLVEELLPSSSNVFLKRGASRQEAVPEVWAGLEKLGVQVSVLRE